MRTTGAVVFVLALGVSFSIISGSGIGVAIFGMDAEQTGGLGPMETLEESGEEGVSDEGSISGDVGVGDGESNLVGFITDGASFITTVVSSVVLLPSTFIDLGLPRYFAIPLGFFIQAIASIGVIQFATGRQYV